ncbi:MAG: glycosyltransferase, partial [Aphanizomenon sp.]
AAEDHQSYNAKVFTQVGAALSFKQSDLTPEILTTQILNLLQSPAELAIMAEKAKTLAVPDSADKLATLVREVMGD